MRLIVAGGRDFVDRDRLNSKLDDILRENGDQLVILSGMARGADRFAYDWAKAHNVPCQEYPAQWDTYGKSAGFQRNGQMAKEADALLAFWDGKSSGTRHMIMLMVAARKRVTIEGY